MAQFLDTNGLKTLINEIKSFVKNMVGKCLNGWTIAETAGGAATPQADKTIDFLEYTNEPSSLYFYKNQDGYVTGKVAGWDDKADTTELSKFDTTLGVERGAKITSADGIYNYLNNNSDVVIAFETLDGAIKEVENNAISKNKLKTINGESLVGSGDIKIEADSGDLTEINDKISNLENLVETNSTSIESLSDDCDVVKESLNLLKNGENLENWKIYDSAEGEYNFTYADYKYNDLKVYNIDILDDDRSKTLTHAKSSPSFKIFKSGKYTLYFYSQFITPDPDANLEVHAYIDSDGVIVCGGDSVVIPKHTSADGFDLIKLSFEITAEDINNESLYEYENNVCIGFNDFVIGESNLAFTPFVLYGPNQEIPIIIPTMQSDIDDLNKTVTVNSAAINEQKEMIDSVKGACCKLIHLNMDLSTGNGTLTSDEMSSITDDEYSNIIAHIHGTYDPTAAQGVNLTGGDTYYFDSVAYVSKSTETANIHIQGCLTDLAGAFPGIYSYDVALVLSTGDWYVVNGGVKIF